jgi:16S rRNA (guanine1207-N2)-methyltransferase
MRLTAPQGEFKLNRSPFGDPPNLQAWDAADEYLLDYLDSEYRPSAGTNVLVLNDSFGALACALSSLRPDVVSDSYLSRQATRFNLIQNDLPETAAALMNSLEPLVKRYDLVLIKVPKILAFLEDQLIRLRPCLTDSSKVILAGMVKNLPASVWSLAERLLGPTETPPARKKARLIFVAPDLAKSTPPNPYPTGYTLENTRYWISNHANVFSREKLDIGTRLFLQQLPRSTEYRDIVDLGCGNGVVGLIAAERNPAATLHFVDESHMAVVSARDNFSRAFGGQRAATFTVGDGLRDFQPESADLVLCNPPFHQQYAVGDQIACEMFKQSWKILRNRGELWVIGNRHLRYYCHLDRLFGAHRIVASDPKFVVLKTKKENRPSRLSPF